MLYIAPSAAVHAASTLFQVINDVVHKFSSEKSYEKASDAQERMKEQLELHWNQMDEMSRHKIANELASVVEDRDILDAEAEKRNAFQTFIAVRKYQKKTRKIVAQLPGGGHPSPTTPCHIFLCRS
ncbi:hypothetical protein FA95DRAFT_225039 [Auriscalpium vulgare]|uniref:Uncharacterized protein n=1 Tax=Auriscalpium vulgare TaxID=40419 RepID=A0ACB8RL88_9AGAM|nr:hypothetical protein FA95DRAFT_225039 [Auriscalpium vulgare]